MATLLRMLALLAAASSCSALVFGPGVGSGLRAASAATGLSTDLSRARVAVMKRTAEERDMLELEGTVVEALRGADFRVQIDDIDQSIMCRISGKIRKYRIKVLVGDRVTCEVSPYDLTKGRITFRRR